MTILNLLLGFLRVGLFSFGGGYAAIPLIRDVVLEYGWMGQDMLAAMIAVSESTPGPIMVNLATYTGSIRAGLPGALTATLAVILPAFVIVLLFVRVERKLLENRYVNAALLGLKSCVTGIILATGLQMALQYGFGSLTAPKPDIKAIGITAGLAVVYFGSRKLRKKGMSPIRLICVAAVTGVLLL